MASNQRAPAIVRAIELNEAMKPRKSLGLRTLEIGSILRVLGFKTIAMPGGNQVIGTFTAKGGHVVTIDMTNIFIDKDNLKTKEVADVFMVYQGLNANGQEQVTFVATKQKASLFANSAMRRKVSLKEASSDSSDSETDLETNDNDRDARNNLKMNIRMW
jgi:hypothetical protein